MKLCQLYKSFLETPIGRVEIGCCEKGVHFINIHTPEEIKSNQATLDNKADEKQTPVLLGLDSWLRGYFESSSKWQDKFPTICPTILSSKGKFTENVWKTLLSNVPAGKTVSYGRLAELCGNAAASRAVGTAMKNNPIPLLIPCHRVVKSDGSIGSYSGGENVKEWLLQHESVNFN